MFGLITKQQAQVLRDEAAYWERLYKEALDTNAKLKAENAELRKQVQHLRPIRNNKGQFQKKKR